MHEKKANFQLFDGYLECLDSKPKSHKGYYENCVQDSKENFDAHLQKGKSDICFLSCF